MAYYAYLGQQNESVGSLSKVDDDADEISRKAIDLALHVHHSFLDNSLPCPISRFVEDVNTRRLFFFS